MDRSYQPGVSSPNPSSSIPNRSTRTSLLLESEFRPSSHITSAPVLCKPPYFRHPGVYTPTACFPAELQSSSTYNPGPSSSNFPPRSNNTYAISSTNNQQSGSFAEVERHQLRPIHSSNNYSYAARSGIQRDDRATSGWSGADGSSHLYSQVEQRHPAFTSDQTSSNITKDSVQDYDRGELFATRSANSLRSATCSYPSDYPYFNSPYSMPRYTSALGSQRGSENSTQTAQASTYQSNSLDAVENDSGDRVRDNGNRRRKIPSSNPNTSTSRGARGAESPNLLKSSAYDYSSYGELNSAQGILSQSPPQEWNGRPGSADESFENQDWSDDMQKLLNVYSKNPHAPPQHPKDEIRYVYGYLNGGTPIRVAENDKHLLDNGDYQSYINNEGQRVFIRTEKAPWVMGKGGRNTPPSEIAPRRRARNRLKRKTKYVDQSTQTDLTFELSGYELFGVSEDTHDARTDVAHCSVSHKLSNGSLERSRIEQKEEIPTSVVQRSPQKDETMAMGMKWEQPEDLASKLRALIANLDTVPVDMTFDKAYEYLSRDKEVLGPLSSPAILTNLIKDKIFHLQDTYPALIALFSIFEVRRDCHIFESWAFRLMNILIECAKKRAITRSCVRRFKMLLENMTEVGLRSSDWTLQTDERSDEQLDKIEFYNNCRPSSRNNQESESENSIEGGYDASDDTSEVGTERTTTVSEETVTDARLGAMEPTEEFNEKNYEPIFSSDVPTGNPSNEVPELKSESKPDLESYALLEAKDNAEIEAKVADFRLRLQREEWPESEIVDVEDRYRKGSHETARARREQFLDNSQLSIHRQRITRELDRHADAYTAMMDYDISWKEDTERTVEPGNKNMMEESDSHTERGDEESEVDDEFVMVEN